jgi:RimJ/RimL family protein N-acetyltransferase
VIFGTRVALGPILPLDLPELFRWADDVDLARHSEPYYPKNWQQQEAFWTNAAADKSRVFFAIRAKPSAAIIGYVQICGIDPVHRSADIGICIGDASHRGQGMGREALELAIAYCWNTLNLTRIALSVFAENQPAIALYARLGFKHEGLLRQARFIAGEWLDLVAMALLHPTRAR